MMIKNSSNFINSSVITGQLYTKIFLISIDFITKIKDN